MYLNLRNPKIIFSITQLSLLFSLVQEITAETKTSPTRPTKFQIKPTLSLLPKSVIATTSASNSTTTSVAAKIHLQNTEAHCPTLLYHRKSPWMLVPTTKVWFTNRWLCRSCQYLKPNHRHLNPSWTQLPSTILFKASMNSPLKGLNFKINLHVFFNILLKCISW